MTDLVDIIILSLDRVDDTVAAIESALGQDAEGVHVIVVDQGSSAAQLARLKDFVAGNPRVTLAELGRNTGVPEGRNIAAGLGSAPYIVALDSDAVFETDQEIAKVIRRLSAEPELGIIAFKILNYYDRRLDSSTWPYGEAKAADAANEFFATRFVGAGHAIRRDAFERAGRYDGRLFFMGEESDLAYRVINLGHKVKYVPEITVLHKVSPTQRVKWAQGRYFFAVRNTIYSHIKYRSSGARILLCAAGYLVNGLCNGLLPEAARGIAAGLTMGRVFRRDVDHEGKRLYQLTPNARRYIAAHGEKAARSALWRVWAQFVRLPQQHR